MLENLLYRLTILEQYIKDVLRCHKNIIYEKIRRVHVSQLLGYSIAEHIKNYKSI